MKVDRALRDFGSRPLYDKAQRRQLAKLACPLGSPFVRISGAVFQGEMILDRRPQDHRAQQLRNFRLAPGAGDILRTAAGRRGASRGSATRCYMTPIQSGDVCRKSEH